MSFVRSSKPDLGAKPALPRLVGLLVLTLFAACGGKHFEASPEASDAAGAGGSSAGAEAGDAAGGGGDSGGSADAGSPSGGDGEGGGPGGTSGASGANPTAGTAGTAGKAATGCASCTAGMYCRAAANACKPCSDFSQLEFAAPEKLSALSNTGAGGERFPRSTGTGSALLYTVGSITGSQLWYAPAPTSGRGSELQNANGPVVGNDSGPLLAPGLVDADFFFDRMQVMTSSRKIMTAKWNGGTLSAVAAAPEPTNVAGSSDYSFAAAPSAGHAYWMSTRNGSAQLIWESINETPMLPPAVLPLEIQIGKAKCERLGDDATPWVNLNGTVLLFSAESMADTCQQNDSHARDVFAASLGKDGLPVKAAVSLSGLNTTGGGSDETDPSFSPDACSIYFASDNGTGNYDLYRAARN